MNAVIALLAFASIGKPGNAVREISLSATGLSGSWMLTFTADGTATYRSNLSIPETKRAKLNPTELRRLRYAMTQADRALRKPMPSQVPCACGDVILRVGTSERWFRLANPPKDLQGTINLIRSLAKSVWPKLKLEQREEDPKPLPVQADDSIDIQVRPQRTNP